MAYKRIVMSKFGEKQMQAAGIDCYYVPHGVETKVMKPIDILEARGRLGLPLDRYIVGMVAANNGNPSRKSFQQQMEAFAAFNKKHPDTMLYIHSTTGERGEKQGFNLVSFAKFLGLEQGKNILFSDQYRMCIGPNGYNDEAMCLLYSSFDVHSLVSMGEGFGIPIIEAQSCGCPVIVGDWTSMSELCFSGWKIPQIETIKFFHQLEAYQFIPRPEAILDAYEAAYNMRGNMDYRRRARDGALAYDADKIVEKYWKPVLTNIEANLPPKLKESL